MEDRIHTLNGSTPAFYVNSAVWDFGVTTFSSAFSLYMEEVLSQMMD